MLNSGTHYFFRWSADMVYCLILLFQGCFFIFVAVYSLLSYDHLITYLHSSNTWGMRHYFFLGLSLCLFVHASIWAAVIRPACHRRNSNCTLFDVVKFWFGGFTEGAVRWILDCVTVLSKLIALKVETKQIHETIIHVQLCISLVFSMSEQSDITSFTCNTS